MEVAPNTILVKEGDMVINTNNDLCICVLFFTYFTSSKITYMYMYCVFTLIKHLLCTTNMCSYTVYG